MNLTDDPETVLNSAGQASSGVFPLFDAALAASALDHNGIDLSPYLAHGDEAVEEALRLVATDITPDQFTDQSVARAVAQALGDCLGGHFGYEGDSEDYDAPENADLIAVIDRRKGLPVALGVLYLHVARKGGWPVYGVNVPGHFVLAAGELATPVIFDPFRKGQILEQDDMAVLLSQVMGDREDDDSPIELSAMNDVDVFIRLLNNQRTRAAQSGDAQRTAEVLRRMVMVAPMAPQLWGEYAEASQAAGNMRAAISAFEHVQTLAPASTFSQKAEMALQSLKRQLN